MDSLDLGQFTIVWPRLMSTLTNVNQSMHYLEVGLHKGILYGT
jgi:hypothetical protein